jgi:hypothetical protein
MQGGPTLLRVFVLLRTCVRGQTGRVLYWESGFLFRLSNLYGYVRVPVCGHSSVCLCATIYVSRPFTSVFIFNILFSNSIFYVNMFYVSDF